MKQWQPKAPEMTDEDIREALTLWDDKPFVYKTVDSNGSNRYDCRKVSS